MRRWSTHPGSQIGYHRTIRGPGGCRPARFRFDRLKNPGCRTRRTARRDDPTGASAGGFVLDHRLENLLNHRLENLLDLFGRDNLLDLFGRDNQAVTFCLVPDPVSLGLHHARRVALHSDS